MTFRLMFLAIAGFWTISCAVGGMAVEHVNESSERLTNVSVRWGGIETAAGTLRPGSRAFEDLIASSVPPMVTVRWRTPDGVLHEEELEVPPIRKRAGGGQLPTVVVTFTDGGPRVSVTAS